MMVIEITNQKKITEMKTTKSNSSKTAMSDLKKNWKTDIVSGFLVFLLALPLSLAIAKASGFPASMGVLTAMIGGIVASLFKVAELSIKGPAAGLITICGAAVIEFGGGDTGWHMVCAVIVVMAIIQYFFGVFKFGSYADFFPHSVIHGMLAAIGLIIIAKQIPVLLGDDPTYFKGETPLELYADIPTFILHAHWHIALCGIIGLLIMFIMPVLKIKFLTKVPAPMIVLLITVPMALFWHFEDTEPEYSLVNIGNFWSDITLNADFSAIGTFTFWKYVLMFLFVSTLESLLTVKAVDNLDPYNRKADANGDLKAQGVSNTVSGLLGGLPMISEVVRSTSNIGFGAKTKWSNFFHGIFLLLAMLFMIPLIELIPNAALATMLIYAGFRLTHPKEFLHTLQVGKEQLVVFLITIFFTLFEDLLVGVAAGIVTELLIHIFNGAGPKHLFKSRHEIGHSKEILKIKINEAATFSNLIGFRYTLEKLPEKINVEIDFSNTKLVDHSFMAFITKFKKEYDHKGGSIVICGLEEHKSFSKHELSARKKKVTRHLVV